MARVSVVDAVETMAAGCNRDDLVERVAEVRETITAVELRVLVVGEHKRGKSTLVNALCNANVSPVGGAAATMLPLWVRHGPEFAAAVRGADGSITAVDPHRLDELVLDDGDATDENQVMVEVQIPRRLGAAAVCLIDCPPTAGAESIGSLMALELADSCDVMLFVTDATQELTAPEVEFLTSACDRRAKVLLVVARSDLSVDPERMARLDRDHLRSAGMASVGVFVVSSHLHIAALAENDETLEAASGFSDLFAAIAKARRSTVEFAAKAAGAELASVVAQLELAARARSQPRPAPEVLAQSARRLESRSAPWRIELRERLLRLRGHSVDSRNRRRIAVVQGYKRALENETSRTTGEIVAKDFFEFLYREINQAFSAHQQWLYEELAKLDADIRENFEMTVDACVLDVLGDLPDSAVGSPRHEAGAKLDRPPLLAALQGWSTAAILTRGAVIGGVVGSAWVPFIAAPIALVLAPRFVREARKRRQAGQKAFLREQAVDVIATSWQALEERERMVLEQVEDDMIEHYRRRGEAVAESLQHTGENAGRSVVTSSGPELRAIAALREAMAL